MNDLAERIQSLRKERNWSQEQLGEQVGVSRQAVSKWEAGTAVPDVENCLALSRAFGIPIGVLLGEPAEISTVPPVEVEKPKRRLLYWLPWGMCVLLTAVCLLLLWNMRRAEVNQLLADPLTETWDAILQETANLNGSAWTLLAVDRATETVQIELSRTPYVYWGGRGWFRLESMEDGERDVIEVPAQWDGSRWTATAEAALDTTYLVTLRVQGWGIQRQFAVGLFQLPAKELMPEVEGTQGKHYNAFDGKTVLDNGRLSFRYSEEQEGWKELWPEITDVRVEVRANGELVAAPEVSEGSWSEQGLRYTWNIGMSMKPGTTYTVTAYWREDGEEQSLEVARLSGT